MFISMQGSITAVLLFSMDDTFQTKIFKMKELHHMCLKNKTMIGI